LETFGEEEESDSDHSQIEERTQLSINDIQNSASGIHIVRCTAHILALASRSIKTLLQQTRNVICTLRTSNLMKELKKQNLPIAIVDVETR